MMEITEKLLRANGWILWTEHTGDEEIPFFEKELNENFSLRFKWGKVYLVVDFCSCELTHIRTMEQLAQLEYLLGDGNTYAASVATLPDELRPFAAEIDAAIGETFGGEA